MAGLKLNLTDTYAHKSLTLVSTRFQKLGFDYVSHGFLELDGQALGWFSNETWAHEYRNKNFSSYDPCVRLLRTTDRHMAMWHSVPKDLTKVDVMKRRCEICNIEDGFSLYYRYESGMQVVVGLGCKTRDQMQQFFLRPQIAELQDLVNSLNQAHDRVRKSAY
jgi:hypothetical protein